MNDSSQSMSKVVPNLLSSFRLSTTRSAASSMPGRRPVRQRPHQQPHQQADRSHGHHRAAPYVARANAPANVAATSWPDRPRRILDDEILAERSSSPAACEAGCVNVSKSTPDHSVDIRRAENERRPHPKAGSSSVIQVVLDRQDPAGGVVVGGPHTPIAVKEAGGPGTNVNLAMSGADFRKSGDKSSTLAGSSWFVA